MPLIERDGEVGLIDAALAAAAAGDGQLVVVQGPAGIGKTALLEVARQQIDRSGAVLLWAQGWELERGFPYGVVRQLFEATLRAAAPARLEQLFSGAAARAKPAVLGPAQAPADPAEQVSGVAHGLYWLVANAASEAPLVLVVDDLQWADAPSLRFLAYLARRLAGLPVAVLGAIRTGDAISDQVTIDEILAVPGAHIVVPTELSVDAVARIVTVNLGQDPDAEFARLCHRATGGNPFYVHQLTAALRVDGIEPVRSSVGTIAASGPRTIARATLARIGRLSEHAGRLAQAIAVLGGDADFELAAALAHIEEKEAAAALEALIQAGILRPGVLEFEHPIVRSAIYEELPPGARSSAHRDAAGLLADSGADPDSVAVHLYLTAPVGAAATMTAMREAAARALAVGAPDAAVAYLSRALEEGPDRDERVGLLLELAQAEALIGATSAIAHFEEVRKITEDRVTRVGATLAQAQMLFYAHPEQALALVTAALGELTDGEEGMRRGAEALRDIGSMFDPRHVHEFVQRLPRLQEDALSGRPGSEVQLVLLGAWYAQQNEPRVRILELADRAWGGGSDLEDGLFVQLLPWVIAGPTVRDALDWSGEVIDQMFARARRTGSVMLHFTALAHEMWIEAQRGNLDAAAAGLRDSIGLAGELHQPYAVLSTLWYGAEVLLERPDLADLAAMVETLDPGPAADYLSGALFIQTRGRLRFAAGDRSAGLADLRHSQAFQEALGVPNPFVPWRPLLALMLDGKDRKEARAMVEAELASARGIDHQRRIGVALRTLGLLATERGAGLARLHEAVEVLAATPARLEQARALVELGSALRRHGERNAARGPLGDGLDLALACGATVTADRARGELEATGGWIGAAATPTNLTPSELRVARMASEGHSSRDIAQALFITTRTVDTHLGRVYTKLGISSRKQLPAALSSGS